MYVLVFHLFHQWKFWINEYSSGEFGKIYRYKLVIFSTVQTMLRKLESTTESYSGFKFQLITQKDFRIILMVICNVIFYF